MTPARHHTLEFQPPRSCRIGGWATAQREARGVPPPLNSVLRPGVCPPLNSVRAFLSTEGGDSPDAAHEPLRLKELWVPATPGMAQVPHRRRKLGEARRKHHLSGTWPMSGRGGSVEVEAPVRSCSHELPCKARSAPRRPPERSPPRPCRRPAPSSEPLRCRCSCGRDAPVSRSDPVGR